jgi:glycosyltransferase involved in cell wall biosynthesis
MLGGGAGVLVPPEQPFALAEAVAKLLEDSELRAEVRARALSVVQGYSAERMAAEVGTVYRSCAPN